MAIQNPKQKTVLIVKIPGKDYPIMLSEYRSRIYNAYVTGRQKTLAPETLEGLKPGLPACESWCGCTFRWTRTPLSWTLAAVMAH